MTLDELTDALDGLHAYDMGATDSGICDEKLRARCIAELKRLMDGPDDGRRFMSLLLREMWLTDEAIDTGYGYEEMLEFVEWLGDYMEVDLR